jgi:hypothetical protein
MDVEVAGTMQDAVAADAGMDAAEMEIMDVPVDAVEA